MSKNLSQLARRKGIEHTLFQELVLSEQQKSPKEKEKLAKEFLVGEAVVSGTASFYDFIEGENADKKAYVCNGSSCLCAGTQENIKQNLSEKFGENNVGHVTCLGRCAQNAAFQIAGKNFSANDIDNLASLAEEPDTKSNEYYEVACTLEQPILTAEINDVAQYYQLFNELVKKFSVDDLLTFVSDSGLRGRGGAGFPTGFKWRSCLEAQGDEKYIVCNADEGDAGAYSDRYLLEQRPHAVMFGMLMSGYLTGAKTGILYIRDEYPDAIINTEKAIAEFNQLSIAFTDNWQFTFKIVRGAGAYICGEETALLRSIEGQRPVVSVRPPFPTQSGLFGCPTVVNNVETFGSIHFILSDDLSKTDKNEHEPSGVTRYSVLGNGKSTGSKLISLDSAFNKPGIYEVAMGTPLADVISLAGGFSKEIKALHIGGPLGGVVPISAIEKLTVDFESFAQEGFLLGHASIIGIPESFSMIDYMAHLFEFTAAESCGKCYPCQIGSTRGHEMVENAISGKQAIDESLLNDLLETMQLGSLCALGGGVPLPIQNILQYFGDEISPFIASGTAKQEAK
ncbi:NADH-ubiquinone oxidoreductase-F iron-sulfur binding region domain-containing protein [Litorilituus lipolyticus]|uniref:NADH-quinone oxidoreductase subunit F n=1 Tax=Litorilituus lipolyticus TaxID=2491017 RepID=A0A502KN39_9GAMM|nr:NADH-ubiquinone oxidoreductase-F iron-sulfur binding region domain-containing protein [Litorilituus lipolyticus]TPH12876.1 formate dehydrogenase [Litorilituus lipolyticus]